MTIPGSYYSRSIALAALLLEVGCGSGSSSSGTPQCIDPRFAAFPCSQPDFSSFGCPATYALLAADSGACQGTCGKSKVIVYGAMASCRYDPTTLALVAARSCNDSAACCDGGQPAPCVHAGEQDTTPCTLEAEGPTAIYCGASGP